VSTENQVPTSADVERVIQHGMPGTSMTSFEALSERQRKLVATEVLRLRQEGLRDRAIFELQEDGVPLAAEEIEATVRRATTPGATIPIPVIDPPEAQDIARGERIYHQQRCDSCHGDDGVGAWDLRLRDDEGNATRPRDLVHEPFKGGHEPEAIYLRLRLGMPGTPHPSSPSLSERESVDLVHYCRSLSKEPQLNLTGHQRRMWATSQSYLRSLGRVRPQ
jgi:mono/diheme cytochrome c family protein